jgi:hypothetical protein
VLDVADVSVVLSQLDDPREPRESA